MAEEMRRIEALEGPLERSPQAPGPEPAEPTRALRRRGQHQQPGAYQKLESMETARDPLTGELFDTGFVALDIPVTYSPSYALSAMAVQHIIAKPADWVPKSYRAAYNSDEWHEWKPAFDQQYTELIL